MRAVQTPQPSLYLEYINAAKSIAEGKRALDSLDIIDSKASGIAGLVGGFAAASMFFVSHATQVAMPTETMSMAIVAGVFLSFAGLMCASCLYILNPMQRGVLNEFKNLPDEDKPAFAAASITRVFDSRTKRYLLAWWSLIIGICIMLVGLCTALLF